MVQYNMFWSYRYFNCNYGIVVWIATRHAGSPGSIPGGCRPWDYHYTGISIIQWLKISTSEGKFFLCIAWIFCFQKPCSLVITTISNMYMYIGLRLSSKARSMVHSYSYITKINLLNSLSKSLLVSNIPWHAQKQLLFQLQKTRQEWSFEF